MKVRYFTVMHSLITKIQVYIVSLTKRYPKKNRILLLTMQS